MDHLRESSLKEVKKKVEDKTLTQAEADAYFKFCDRFARHASLMLELGDSEKLAEDGFHGNGAKRIAEVEKACAVEGAGTSESFCELAKGPAARSAAKLMTTWDRPVDNGITADDL
jgi:hypothetical protein